MDCSYSKLPAEDIENDVHDPIKPKPSEACKGKCKGKRCVWRCFKIILKLMCVLFLFFFGAVALTGIHIRKWIAHEVEEWTVIEPQKLPVVKVERSEIKAFKDEAKAFNQAIQHDEAAKDLVVPARILNGLASYSDYLSGNAYAEMKTNEVTVEVSLPMDGLPGGKGRYLVGTETLTWDPESSEIHLKMEPLDETKKIFFDFTFLLAKDDENKFSLEMISGQFLDWTVPQDFIDDHINLLEDFYHCDCHDKECKHMRKVLLGIDSISIEEDQVVVHPRNSDPLHRSLAEFVPSNKPGWKWDLGRRLVGF